MEKGLAEVSMEFGIDTYLRLIAPGLLAILVSCSSSGREVSGNRFVQLAHSLNPNEVLSFRDGGGKFYYLECYRLSPDSKPKRLWTARANTTNLTESQITCLEHLNFKSALNGLSFSPNH